MSIPQRHADETDDDFPALVELESGVKPPSTDMSDDYDSAAAIALLRQFRDEPSEDAEAEWAEFIAFARAIDEDRAPGRTLFDTFLTE